MPVYGIDGSPGPADLHGLWRERSREGDPAVRERTWTRANGESATRTVDIAATDDGVTLTSTHTSPSGKSLTVEASVASDPEAGTLSVSLERILPNDKTWTKELELAMDADGATLTSTFTRPSGLTVTRTYAANLDQGGLSVEGSVSRTLPGGRELLARHGQSPITA
ncbi:MAG: hypothetical protein AB1916_15815 [Thermodesulfobacteriota bacterium]